VLAKTPSTHIKFHSQHHIDFVVVFTEEINPHPSALSIKLPPRCAYERFALPPLWMLTVSRLMPKADRKKIHEYLFRGKKPTIFYAACSNGIES
jgi:hypothetical protein